MYRVFKAAAAAAAAAVIILPPYKVAAKLSTAGHATITSMGCLVGCITAYSVGVCPLVGCGALNFLCCVLQVAGIIAGQLTLGFVADRIGRKWGSVTTASFMLIGGILILASAGNHPHSIFLMYTTCQVRASFPACYTAPEKC